MATPFRTSGGSPCPRCKLPLQRHDDELRCPDGHGAWIDDGVLARRVEPAELPRLSRGNPFKATALPPTRCLTCSQPLNDLYAGERPVLSVGQCVEHGAWIESGDLAAFDRAYGVVAGDAPRVTPATARARVVEVADPLVRELLARIEALEAEVRTLRAQLDRHVAALEH